jgi:hypothetical protein
MKELSARSKLALDTLPAASEDLAGVIVRLTSDNAAYWCNGTVWEKVQSSYAPPPVPGDPTRQLVKQISSGTIPGISGTALTPVDHTVPLITEGSQIWSQLFAPFNEGSTVLINCSFVASVSSNNRKVVASIFRDSVCVAVSMLSFVTANQPQSFVFVVADTSISDTSVTYSCRVGVSSNSTWYVNVISSALFGGKMAANGYSLIEW